jgi:hypothetical protein
MPDISSTHLWHNSLTLEASPHAIINTLRLPPAGSDAVEAVALVAVEAVRALLDDRDMLGCGDHLCGIVLVLNSLPGHRV